MLKAALGKLLQQMEHAQEEMGKIQDELASIRVEGSAAGDIVKVIVNARKEILKVSFDEDAFRNQDKEFLEELTVVAVNQALEKADEIARAEMQKAAGGVLGNLPGGLNLSELMDE